MAFMVKFGKDGISMADMVIMALLAAAVFFILRGRIRRAHDGRCSGGCGLCGQGKECRPGGCMEARDGKS